MGSTAFSLGCRCAIAVCATLALAGLAGADQTHDCDAYAAQAVAQQHENLTLGCGFGGGAWSADAQGHRAWCRLRTVGMADLVREDQARAAALAQCRQKDAACRNYADFARLQQRQNRRLRCNFVGGRWSEDVAGHRAWCMTADARQSEGEIQTRQSALEACTAKLSETAKLSDIDMQNAEKKQRQLMRMMEQVLKNLQEIRSGAVRRLH